MQFNGWFKCKINVFGGSPLSSCDQQFTKQNNSLLQATQVGKNAIQAIQFPQYRYVYQTRRSKGLLFKHRIESIFKEVLHLLNIGKGSSLTRLQLLLAMERNLYIGTSCKTDAKGKQLQKKGHKKVKKKKTVKCQNLHTSRVLVSHVFMSSSCLLTY